MDQPSAADDEVVRVDVPWKPAPSSAAPVLFQDGDRAVLIFTAAGQTGSPTSAAKALRRRVSPAVAAREPGVGARVELRFDDCLATRFGPREAGSTSLGLREAGLYEVVRSPWLGRLVVPAHATSDGSWPPFPARHFVVALGDMTFECLCAAVRGRATDLTVAEILPGLAH